MDLAIHKCWNVEHVPPCRATEAMHTNPMPDKLLILGNRMKLALKGVSWPRFCYIKINASRVILLPYY